MELEPVRRYRRPGYPTRSETQSRPRWLLAHLPDNWKQLLASGGSGLVLLAAGMSGCEGQRAAPGKGGPQSAATSASAPADTRGAMATIVAPIFDHGVGRGVSGCVVIAPPVFLSEEEALQVIQEELGKLGIELTDRDVAMPEVPIKQQIQRYEEKGGELVARVEEFGPAKPLELQLVDPKRHVAVEFVGQKNYEAVGGPQSASTVQRYDFKDRASFVAQEIRMKSNGFIVGVFYDPALTMEVPELTTQESQDRSSADLRWKKAYEDSKASAREQLRQQVQDLAKWLKSQGAM